MLVNRGWRGGSSATLQVACWGRDAPGCGLSGCFRLSVTATEELRKVAAAWGGGPGWVRGVGAWWDARSTQLAKLRYFAGAWGGGLEVASVESGWGGPP